MRTSCAGLIWIARRLVGLCRADSGKVLTWNGSAWTAQSVPGDNWGSQVVQVNAPLTGDGTSGNPLGLAIDATTLSVNASDQLTANKDSAIWNANQLCGTDLDCSTLSGLVPSRFGEGADVEMGARGRRSRCLGTTGGRRWCRVNAPLTGDGTSGNPLGLAIDATTLSVNASDQLTANNTVRFGMRTSCAGLLWIARRLVGLGRAIRGWC
jgi:hypothetical protein